MHYEDITLEGRLYIVSYFRVLLVLQLKYLFLHLGHHTNALSKSNAVATKNNSEHVTFQISVHSFGTQSMSRVALFSTLGLILASFLPVIILTRLVSKRIREDLASG